MPFSHGSKAKIFTNGADISAYLKNVEASSERDNADTSALADTSKKFISGLLGGVISGDGMHDGTISAAITSVLQAAIGQEDSETTYFPNGDTIGSFGHGIQGELNEFSITAPVDDVTAVSFEAQSDKGLERVASLRPIVSATLAGTTNHTSIDNAVGTSAGLAAYLHVSAMGAGTALFRVLDSTDDSTYAALATFAEVTAGMRSQRVYVGGTVARYLRGQVILTGAGTVVASLSATRTPNNL